MGILNRVSGLTWGLDTSVLRMTTDASVTSLLRYGLAITGSLAYEQSLVKLDTAVVNVTARRILVAGQV